MRPGAGLPLRPGGRARRVRQSRGQRFRLSERGAVARPLEAMRHNVAVFQNVIVPFDGSLPARAALAPAADLAWRCGGRIVIVNNTDASDKASRDALKSRAMSMSGADVDFWVDVDHT